MRQKGKTYSEIKQSLSVSKSTLSEWLKNVSLTKAQMKKLEVNTRIKKYASIKKIRRTKLNKKKLRQQSIYETSLRELLPFSKREFYISGLMLYLGEGVKGDNSTVSLNNTDPSVVKFYLYWLVHGLGIDKKRVRVTVHLYKDMNVETCLNYWSQYLNISRTQFVKPYIKNSRRIDIDQKGYGKGTCGLYIYDRGNQA